MGQLQFMQDHQKQNCPQVSTSKMDETKTWKWQVIIFLVIYICGKTSPYILIFKTIPIFMLIKNATSWSKVRFADDGLLSIMFSNPDNDHNEPWSYLFISRWWLVTCVKTTFSQINCGFSWCNFWRWMNSMCIKPHIQCILTFPMEKFTKAPWSST